MFARKELVSIVMLLCLDSVSAKVRFGPTGMSFNDTTTCAEFSKFGRFNPYSVLFEKWFVFYYWAPPITFETYIFTFPTANHTKHLHKILDGKTNLPVNWRARQILMEDQDNHTVLLVERGDRGEYWYYPLYKVTGGQKIKPRDVRLKQTSDNRILGFMDCVRQTLLVMARINDVPRKTMLLEEASRLGYRGRRGKSYLYQGHEWGPIPEDDEENYWQLTKPRSAKQSNEGKSSEENSKEAEQEPTNDSEKPVDEEEAEINNIDPKIEKDLKERCDQILPELWNDPKKPEPVKDPRRITKEQLDSPHDIVSEIIPNANLSESNSLPKQDNELDIALQNTSVSTDLEHTQEDSKVPDKNQTTNAPDGLAHKNRENKTPKESKGTQPNRKIENLQDSLLLNEIETISAPYVVNNDKLVKEVPKISETDKLKHNHANYIASDTIQTTDAPYGLHSTKPERKFAETSQTTQSDENIKHYKETNIVLDPTPTTKVPDSTQRVQNTKQKDQSTIMVKETPTNNNLEKTNTKVDTSQKEPCSVCYQSYTELPQDPDVPSYANLVENVRPVQEVTQSKKKSKNMSKKKP